MSFLSSSNLSSSSSLSSFIPSYSQEDYLNFPAPFFLVLLRDDSLLPTFKFHLLRLWAGRHEERKEDIFTLAMALPFKGLADAKVWGFNYPVGVTMSTNRGLDNLLTI